MYSVEFFVNISTKNNFSSYLECTFDLPFRFICFQIFASNFFYKFKTIIPPFLYQIFANFDVSFMFKYA